MCSNLVTVLATPRLHLKKSNAQETFPSTLRVNFVLCELWPSVLLKPHVFYIHVVQFRAQKVLQHFNIPVGGQSYSCTTFLKKKYGPITPKLATAHQTVTRGEWSCRSWDFSMVTSSPVAKILLISRYGSEPNHYSEEQLQREPVQEFPHLWLCGWHDLSHLILEPT
jgi:hypothetical protein